ncbi:hypothetical protein POTOM_007313 [Populus tomentosa]|uniref:Jacalin-type lectin domain-containing protein n=1 Tax=Populus tomentosa TaxID=118781 RepID=A0A8X8AFH1_POPTO|nr:hypothetical protein POTOM_007313 [Populus tomentosa]
MGYEGYGNSHVSVGPWGGQSGTMEFTALIPGSNLQVKLDYPDEYPVSISGYILEYGPVLVRSLMFETNKKKYGPFGIHYGTYFSNPMTGGKIVGFHGRSSWYLDSIGVYLMPLLRRNPSNTFSSPQYYTTNGTNEKNKGYNYDLEDELSNKVVVSRLETHSIGFVNTKQAVSHGTWGGNGGNIFDDRVYTGVREVHLTRYGGVVSIRVCYDLNGQATWGSKNKGSGGIRLDKIAFDYSSEILTHITGYYGSTMLRGPTIVKSLTFYTNKRKYGPFGDEQGISFSSGFNNGVIVGFHGRKGWFIDSIGVIPRAAKEATPPVSGPWGGGGGKPWDDGVFYGVKKTFLTKGEAIYCIQIKYDRNGQSVWSVRHGGGSEGSSNMVIISL